MKSTPILNFLYNPSIHVIATQGRHKTFPVSQKVPFCPLPINIHSPEVISTLIFVISWPACELHINEIIQYTVFCVSCFLLTKISMTLIHAVVCISYLILCSCPLYEQISTDTSLILLMGIWVVASLEAIMKNATMYILALISRWTHVLTSLEYISGGLNAESQ